MEVTKSPPTMIRVEQANEPEHFLRVFAGSGSLIFHDESLTCEKAKEKEGNDEKKKQKKEEAKVRKRDDEDRDFKKHVHSSMDAAHYRFYQTSMQGLKHVLKKDMGELKSLKQPPRSMMKVFAVVCMLCGIKPKKTRKIAYEAGSTLEKAMDSKGQIIDPQLDAFWPPMKKFLGNYTNMMQTLEGVDNNSVEPKSIMRLSQYLERDDFTPEAISKICRAGVGMCRWAHAIYDATCAERLKCKHMSREGVSLYHVRGSKEANTLTVQVPAQANSISSRGAFIAIRQAKRKADQAVWLWIGEASSFHVAQIAAAAAVLLIP
jgi:dynein heavy chain